MKSKTNPQLIWQALDAAANMKPSPIGYIYQGRKISFKEMDELSDHLASGLLKLGYAKGDRLGIIALTQPEWLITYFAAAKIGVIIVGLNVRYRDSELEYMINQSQARGVITLAGFGDINYITFFDSFKEEIPTVSDFIFIGGEGMKGRVSFEDILATEIDKSALDQAKSAITPEDMVMIIYTSGTTGRPKGASLTNKSQLSSAKAQADHCKVTSADIGPMALPLNHVGEISCSIVVNLLKQATTILMPAFSPAEFIEQARLHGATVIGGVPTMHTLIINHETFSQFDTSTVRLVLTGGSNADPPLLTKMYEAYPNASVMNLYGLSEVSGGMIMSPWDCDFDTTIRSIGKVMGDFQAKVIDSEGQDLPVGKAGELCLKGDALTAGYYRKPEATAVAFDDEGWLHTGDIAYIDEEGYVTLMGRLKEMYIQGGYNVYPVEVENLLATHPGVLMAAGFGVPDPVLGEVGRYYIIPRPGVELAIEELIIFCKNHLANYKIPKQFVIRDQLPLTPVGKIMKSQLKKEYEEMGS